MSNYPKISEEKYRKSLGQLRLQMNDVFHPLRMYGQDVYCDGGIDEACEL